MESFGAVTLSTTDTALWDKLFDLKLEGVTIEQLLQKSHSGDKLVFRAVIIFASNLATSVMGCWLYDHFYSHPESEAKIEGQRVAKDCLDITNVIMEGVTINNNYRVKRPENQ